MADMMKKVPVREQDPKVRATNFEEVCLGYNQEEAMEEAQRCLGCKKPKCVEGCPKHLISLIPYSNTVQVACSSTDKGPVTMKDCTTGCVGCGICVKNCQHDAVKVENFHAVIDPEKCVGCGACMEKCPKKCIVKA